MSVRHFGGLQIHPPLPTKVVAAIKGGTPFDRTYAHKDETVGLLPDGSVGIIGEAFTVIRPELSTDANGHEPDTYTNHVEDLDALKEVDNVLVAADSVGQIKLGDYTVKGALYCEEGGRMSRLFADDIPLSQLGTLTSQQAQYSWPNGDVTNHRGEKVKP